MYAKSNRLPHKVGALAALASPIYSFDEDLLYSPDETHFIIQVCKFRIHHNLSKNIGLGYISLLRNDYYFRAYLLSDLFSRFASLSFFGLPSFGDFAGAEVAVDKLSFFADPAFFSLAAYVPYFVYSRHLHFPSAFAT